MKQYKITQYNIKNLSCSLRYEISLDQRRSYTKEKELYGNLSLEDFVQRLLTKRCVTFVGAWDSYKLITGQSGYGHSYDQIGKDSEEEPLLFKNCLSYDEVKLSAFLSVSSHTELINNGNRKNNGIIETDLSKIEREGVVIGLIGSRFQRPFVMDYQDIVISPEQNVKERGYGQHHSANNWDCLNCLSTEAENPDLVPFLSYRKLWQKFYEEPSFLYHHVKKDKKRFSDVGEDSKEIFDNVAMKKRFTISFDTLLLEAQGRAEQLNKQAYVHIVGIGLGVWRLVDQQIPIFLETFSQRAKHLLPKLNNIGVLHFSWFGLQEWGDLKHDGFITSETHPLGGIRTLLANRNPADKLKEPEFENMLLVISFAWDANALPGNEFWAKHLADSSDSSTASSTLITELHNAHINTEWVCGGNLHIASAEHGIMHISDYAKKMQQSQ